MEANAQLFSGLAGVLDRTAAFTTPSTGKPVSRTSDISEFLAALLEPESSAEALLFYDGRVAAIQQKCEAGCESKTRLVRVPLGLVLKGTAKGDDAADLMAQFKARAIVLGTLHDEADSSSAYKVTGKKSPIAAVELKDLGDEAAVTAKIHEWLAASGCKCGACGGPVKAALMEGRKMLFEQANPCRPIVPRPREDKDKPLLLLPKEVDWPVSFQEAALFGMARSLLVWRSKSNFCSCCGGAMEAVEGGVKRTCLSCKQSAWQRTDPVVITAVTNPANTHLLLGRQPAFPPGYYSTLAGFLEPGESIEDAVRREIKEESGISLSAVHYLTSQHWPIGRGTFGQIMIGCLGVAANDDIVADKEELEDCQWFSRAEVEEAVTSHFKERERRQERRPSADKGTGSSDAASTSAPSGAGAWGGSDSPKMRLKVPGPFAIAHCLMQEWLKRTPATTATPAPSVGGSDASLR